MTAQTATSSIAALPFDPASPDALRHWWVNAWRPSHDEPSYEVTDVEGEIPRELHGTLYRIGPSQHVLPPQGFQAMHLFDGDGLAHAFRFDDGRLHVTSRFVRNESFRVEEEEGRFCMTSVGLLADDPTDRVPIRQQPNTNLVYHAGTLMAMVENALPFNLAPRTLDPLGTNTLQSKPQGIWTSAHPKIDGRTGQMVLHGYQPTPPYVHLCVVEPDGTVSLAEAVDTPYPVMMHDLAITEHYVILLLCPVVWDEATFMEVGLGRATVADALRWQPERGFKLGVRRREPGAEVRWFDVPTPGFIFHPGNAYEADGTIVMDACTYLDGQGLLDELRRWRSGNVEGGFNAVPFLYELDLETGTCRETQLDDRSTEFPRIDDRLVGHRNRYGYAMRVDGTDAGAPPFRMRTVKYDRAGGPTVAHDYGTWQWPSEPVFAPRAADAAEDDGFVLTVVYDGPADGTYVAIHDARDLAGAPLATARLRHRIPQGFHGNFAPGVV